MRIEYDLKRRDHFLFSIAHAFFSMPTQICIGILSIWLASGYELPLGHAAAYAVIFYLGYWIIYSTCTAIALMGRDPCLRTNYVVTIQDDDFLVETEFGKYYNHWKGLTKIVTRPGFVAVYINARVAHILPVRAFSSKDDKKAFVAALTSKREAAKN